MSDHRPPVIRLLEDELPRRPRCFGSDDDWRQFLLVAHEAAETLAERVVRRQDTGKHRGERKVITVLAETVRQLPCQDCKPEFRREMEAVGRCERAPAIKSARRWLKALLSAGPMLSTEIRSRALADGFAWSTVKLAKFRDGIEDQRAGYQQLGVWFLPSSRPRFESSRPKFVRPPAAARKREPEPTA